MPLNTLIESLHGPWYGHIVQSVHLIIVVFNLSQNHVLECRNAGIYLVFLSIIQLSTKLAVILLSI